LDFISQFTTDIKYISGDENIVADALSTIEELQSPMDYSALVTSQETDKEPKRHDQRKSGLRLETIDVPGTGVAICDTSMGIPRPVKIYS